jgi:hypothetical protein
MNDIQNLILNELKTDGISIKHIDDFNSDIKNSFSLLTNYYEIFSKNPKIVDLIKRYNHGEKFNSDKDFEINSKHFLNRDLNLGDSVVDFYLNDFFVDISSAYLKTLPKIFQINSWIHISSPKRTSRIKSMNWHRDPEDNSIFKIYVIVNDVGELNGPYQYVKGSHLNGKYGRLNTNNRYIDNDFFEKNVDKNDIVSLIGRKGTIAFVDNYGFHRGGFVQEGIRFLTQAVFLKPEVFNNEIFKSQRISFNINHPSYNNLSPMCKYCVE